MCARERKDTFKGGDKKIRKIDLTEEVAKVRTRMEEIEQWNEEQYAENRKKIAEAVDVVIGKIQNKA